MMQTYCILYFKLNGHNSSRFTTNGTE
jgi:hypothetical protein